MEEIWKDIPRYEGYQASTKGRIRTFNKVTYTERHGYRQWKNRILKFKPSSFNSHSKKQGSGYRVTLWKDGKSKDFLVARLIATTFLEDLIDTNMTVNHKDGNRTNNNIENLEWLSMSENIKYSFKKGQYKQIKTKSDKNFSKGNLYYILKNKIYTGKIVHKQNEYDGEHPAIIPTTLFEKTQTLLASNAIEKTCKNTKRKYFKGHRRP